MIRMKLRVFGKRPLMLAMLFALPVSAAIANAQTFSQLVDVGPLLYPAGTVKTTEMGWPLQFLTEGEYSDRLLPQAGSRTWRINSLALALNVMSWMILIGCSAYLIWITVSRTQRISIAHALAFTAGVSVLLCYWRTKYQSEVQSLASFLGDSSEMRTYLLLESRNPLIRLTTFSAFTKTGVVAGMLSAIAITVHLMIAMARAITQAIRRTKP